MMPSTKVGFSSPKFWNNPCCLHNTSRRYSKLKTMGYKPFETARKTEKQFVSSGLKRDLVEEMYTSTLVSPNFIKSLNDDIDKIKNRKFTDGWVTIKYGKNSYTPFFLINFASKMLNLVPGCEKIAREYEEIVTREDGWERMSMLNYYYPPKNLFSESKGGRIIAAGSTGIRIRQTPSNSEANITNPKLSEALKKSSEIFFKKLYENCEIPDLSLDNSLPEKEKLEKYKNKFALVIDGKARKNLGSYQCAIAWLLAGSGLSDQVDFLNYDTLTGVYGEKENIQKFITILYAQQFLNSLPSMVIQSAE